jgi:hypothetical protein
VRIYMGKYFEVNLEFLSTTTYVYNEEIYTETIFVIYRNLRVLLFVTVQRTLHEKPRMEN